MSLTHITSHSLRRLLSLTEKKEQLLKGIEDIENEISKALTGTAKSVVSAAESVSPFKASPKKKGGKSKGTKPGSLKDRILALLEAAGDQGLKVKEIAEKLGTKTGNISVWFSTTGKNHTTKVEPGRYTVKGKGAVKAAVKTAPAKKAAAKKPAKKSKSGSKKS